MTTLAGCPFNDRNQTLPMVDVNSCACPKAMCFNTLKRTNIRSDDCNKDFDTIMSIAPGAYNLENFHSCTPGAPAARSVQLSQPTMNINFGVGYIGERGALVDNDSKVKYSELTNRNTINTLNERPYLTVPYMGRGIGDSNIEPVLRSGEDTFQHKPCNALAGVTIDNFFTPMVPCLKREIQNTKHIIPEDSMKCWVRGGLPSRQIVKNMDYMKRCTKYVI
jgi:hypothetical protein